MWKLFQFKKIIFADLVVSLHNQNHSVNLVVYQHFQQEQSGAQTPT